MASYPAQRRAAVAVIIPAYNEAGNIERTVREVRSILPESDVIVINDASRDATSALARQAGALVLDLPFNLGIGGAVQTGYTFAAAHGYTLIARLDGDGQHDPAQLAGLIAPVRDGEVDIAIGSRFIGAPRADGDHYRASLVRGGGIRLFANLVSLIIQQRVTDTTSGFQVCNAAVASFLGEHCPCDYPEVEMVAALGRSGYRIREIPVQMRRRLAGRSSITPVRSAYYAFKVTLALLIGLLRSPALRPEPRPAAQALQVGAPQLEFGAA